MGLYLKAWKVISVVETRNRWV